MIRAQAFISSVFIKVHAVVPGMRKHAVQHKMDALFRRGFSKRRERLVSAEQRIDLLIIGDVLDGNRLDELMEGVEKRLGRTLNYIVYGQAEFESKVKVRNAFLMDVLEDDLIMVAGRREELPPRNG